MTRVKELIIFNTFCFFFLPVGSPLPREERFDVQNDGRLLQIRYVEEKDKGLYTCRAINDVATVEVSAELTILQQCKFICKINKL